MKVVDGKKSKEVAYVCIYTTGEELEWVDKLDRTLGRFVYWGDNRKAGKQLTRTKSGGNEFLEDIYSKLALLKDFFLLFVKSLNQIVFVFQHKPKQCGFPTGFLDIPVAWINIPIV